MLNFLKKIFRKRESKVEPWANFFTEEEFNMFISIVEKILKDQNYKYKREGSSIIFDTDNVVYLDNVAKYCKQSKLEDWESYLGQFFAQISSIYSSSKLDELLADFNTAKDHIVARIVPDDYLNIERENTKFLFRQVFRQDIPQTLTLLMADSGTAFMSVTKDKVNKWNVDEKTIFDCAIKNVAKNYKFETTTRKVNEENNISLNFVFSPDILASSVPLLFDSQFRDLMGKYGVLFCIPSGSFCISHAFNDVNTYFAVYELFQLADQMFHTEAKPVSPNVYWYHDGQYEVLDVKFKDQSIEFKPSETFMDVFEFE